MSDLLTHVAALVIGVFITTVFFLSSRNKKDCNEYSSIFGTASLFTLTSLLAKSRPLILKKRGSGHTNHSNHSTIAIGDKSDDHRFCCTKDNTGSLSKWSKSKLTTGTKSDSNSLFRHDCVAHLETNLDDLTGESIAFALETLLDNGALDAWVTPIVMKKGRPAYTLHCLCKDNNDECYQNEEEIGDYDHNETNCGNKINELLGLIFIHTRTLGIRIYRNIPRAKLDRSVTSVQTSYIKTSRNGFVDVKVSKFKNGTIVQKKAEFDHCKSISMDASNWKRRVNVNGAPTVTLSLVAEEAIKAYDQIER